MLLCSWFGYRVNNGPHEYSPFLLEPTEPPERWQTAGYAPCAHYTSTLMPHEPILKASIPIAAQLESEGWSIESLPKDSHGHIPEDAFIRAVDTIHHIAHEAFADAFGFVPLPRDALQSLYAPYRLALDPDLILFATDPSGTPAGFIFGVPDLADSTRKWAIIKTSAIRPSHAGRRLGTWLNATAHRRFRRKGYRAAVYALMWEGSASQSWSRFGGEPLRRYSLLERSLAK
ncbi:MAG: putative N-acetyltransferase YhbS [bacterium]|jgi:predicted N-acetyltransferase YhbS